MFEIHKNRPEIGDYVTWRTSKNSKKDLFGFIVHLYSEEGTAHILTTRTDTSNIWKLGEFRGNEFDYRARQYRHVSKAPIDNNILNWTLELVLLWYSAQGRLLRRHRWSDERISSIISAAKEDGKTRLWTKKVLVISIRSEQRRVGHKTL